MAYTGQTANIPLGARALLTDLPQTQIDPTFLIRAENITTGNSLLEKDFGSMRWNATANLGVGIAQAIEWKPDPQTRRVIVVGKDGKVYRFVNEFTFAEVLPTGGAPAVLDISNGFVTMTAGGVEETGNPRKLFIFSGNSPVQIIVGDGTTRRDIASPTADWSGLNHPFSGIVHLGLMFMFGNQNAPHTLYASPATDHEDFSSPLLFQVDPGEGDGLRAQTVYLGRLYLGKFPRGLYQLQTPTVATSTWFPERVFSTFGVASPTALTPVLGDFLVGNEYGSITTVAATQAFGDVTNADLFHITNTQDFVREQISKTGFNERHAIFYKDKKEAFFTFRSLDSQLQDRIVRISYKDPTQPQIMWSTKDQPNNLFTLSDNQGIEKPAYGSEDGYIYMMDSVNRWVGDTIGNETEYEMVAQTPHVDFGSVDRTLSEQMKIFDFVELGYEPTGREILLVDVFIDQKFTETIKIELSGRTSELNASKLGSIKFDERVSRSKRIPLHGTGRRISLRARMSTLLNARLVEFKVYFRLAGQRQTE